MYEYDQNSNNYCSFYKTIIPYHINIIHIYILNSKITYENERYSAGNKMIIKFRKKILFIEILNGPFY